MPDSFDGLVYDILRGLGLLYEVAFQSPKKYGRLLEGWLSLGAEFPDWLSADQAATDWCEWIYRGVKPSWSEVQ